MRFSQWYFLVFIIPVILLFLLSGKQSLPFSNVGLLKQTGRASIIKHRIGRWFIAAAMCSFIIAMARPQIPTDVLPAQGQGIDIMMILDVSGSMESVDFKPNRLEVARETIDNFIDKRFEDRIGLVIFAGTAYTRVPLTLDHDVVKASLQDVSTASVGEDGTAIGMAISVGINRLKKSQANSKVMILVTDGDNNAGAISPDTAAQLASEEGIKVYSIGVGTDQTIMPVDFMGQTRYQTMDSGLNEPLLQSIADSTGGQYFRAADEEKLTATFEDIDQLEKTDFDQDEFMLYDELAFVFIKLGLLLMLIGIFLDRYLFIRIP